MTTLLAAVIHSLAGLDIGAHQIKPGRIGIISGTIKNIVFGGDNMIGKLGIENIARCKQRFKAAITAIARKSLVVAQSTPRLPRLVIAPESSTRRHPDDAVELDNSNMSIDEQNRWLIDLYNSIVEKQ